MRIRYGTGKTEYGPGIDIFLSGDEVAIAIDSWLVGQNVNIQGPRTVTVNNKLCTHGHIYVDPSGFVIAEGRKFSGRGLVKRRKNENKKSN
jgi:hypothetical protein